MKTTLVLAALLALTGASAMAQGTQAYPPCSATRQDRCVQTHNRAASHATRHARNERSARMHRQQHAMNTHHRHAMRTHHRRHEQTRQS